MKTKKKPLARELRARGYSLKDITARLNVSKSSVSIWVRDIELTHRQRCQLLCKAHAREVEEKRRQTRLVNEHEKREKVIEGASLEVRRVSRRELWLMGTVLYWAEGGKTVRGLVRFSNSDPDMIGFMMKYFRKICSVPEKKFRCYLHIHPHLDHKKAERYWSEITKVPLKQFFKTSRMASRASKNKKDSLPLGTLEIYVCNTELFLKICGWLRSIFLFA